MINSQIYSNNLLILVEYWKCRNQHSLIHFALKAELDEIMKGIDIIMKKVETVVPAKEEEIQPQNE